MWDLAGYDGAALDGLSGMACFDAMREMMRTGRPPPMAPPQFAQMLRGKVKSGDLTFSAEADVETVLKMYHDGFVDTFERYRRFDPEGFFAAWAGLKWGESEAALLASALSFAARHCQLRNSLGPLSLRLEGNRFGRTGETAIRAAIVGSKTFERVLF